MHVVNKIFLVQQRLSSALVMSHCSCLKSRTRKCTLHPRVHRTTKIELIPLAITKCKQPFRFSPIHSLTNHKLW